MGAKLPYTPNSQIRQALRILWMRSRERSQALKNTNRCCAYCGVKASQAKGRDVKLDVHHLDPIDWEGLFDEIRRRILHDPARLAPSCEACHDKAHGGATQSLQATGGTTPPPRYSADNPTRSGTRTGMISQL